MYASATTFAITPQRALDQGSGLPAARVRPSERAAEPLEVNMLALWGADDSEPVVMVTLDLLYPGRAIRTAVEDAAAPLPADRVFVAASHTHQAPMTASGKPLLGRPDDEYVTWLQSELRARIPELLNPENRRRATVDVAETVAAHSVNRRRRVRFYPGRRLERNVVAIAPDPAGITDEQVIVLTMRDEHGAPLAHVWNYACHPVAHPRPETYSAHFPHRVRERFRSTVGAAETPVLFLQGFSGNTRPNASIGFSGARGLVRRLVSGPQFRSMTSRRYHDWASSLATVVVDAPLRRTSAEVDRIETRRVERPGTEFAATLDHPVSFHSLRLSDVVTIAGVSGEAVAEYSAAVSALSRTALTMRVGCIDDTFGYIPTTTMLAEGGYEGRGFCRYFGVESVHPDVEVHTLAGFRAVLQPE